MWEWAARMSWSNLRDIGLFLGGLAILGYEMVIVPEPREALLLVAVAMLGLPATIYADAVTKRPRKDPPKSDPP